MMKFEMRNPMSKRTIASASSPATWLARRRRSTHRPRRVIQRTSIPPVQSQVVMNSEEIQLKLNLHSDEALKIKVRLDDEPDQEVVDPGVKKLRIVVSKSKTMRMLVPLDPDGSRLLILADVCCEHLRPPLPDVSSPSDNQ